MSNPLSFSSLKLDLFSKEGVRLKPASGFVVEAGSRYYLITNRHVVRGEPEEPASEPYELKTSLHIYEGEGEKSAPLSWGMRKRITVRLYDDNAAPRWIERRADEQHQPAVDLVVLPIQFNLTFASLFSGKIPGSNIKAIQWARISAIPISAIDTDVEYGPPDTVYVIGYPLGWAPAGTDKSSAAFWRTSSIASEIYEPGKAQANAFFIDPCAPEGMTGSPVVGMKNDRLKLLGVYSDSSTAGFGANAGLVWDAFLVKELIRAA
ncbi:MAG TPA: trypsin-like peptidase domain-containing protein [Anaerolineales bacterium]|nr:trypsin-like peptidase domain-containing protein [Anaerolineales bacterium]